MDVSVVIVNWNTKEILHDCLASLYANTRNIDFEVFVVDNGSTDGSVEMVKSEFPKVILIENKENRGFAAANNQALKIAIGRYILLLNSDTVIFEHCITNSLAYMDQNPKIGISTCKVLNPDGSLQDTYFSFPSVLNLVISALFLDKLFPQNKLFGRVRLTNRNRDGAFEVDVVAGCYMLVRRKALEEVGKMDSAYFMYAEETDWCFRFKKKGWKVVYAPFGEMIHLEGQSAKMKSDVMFKQMYGSVLLFLYKNKSRAEYISSCIIMSLHFIIRLPYWFVKLLIAGADETIRYRCILRCKMTVLPLLGWRFLCAKTDDD